MTVRAAPPERGPSVLWNPRVRLVFADVDETVAGLHEPATPDMVAALCAYLRDGGRLCLVTGGSLGRVRTGVTDALAPALRRQVLVAPASGAELWGFDARGRLHETPLVKHAGPVLTPDLRDRWLEVLEQVVGEFGLRLHHARPPRRFQAEVGCNRQDVMFSDRGPQMSIEFVNAHGGAVANHHRSTGACGPAIDGADLRSSVMERASHLLGAAAVPVNVRLTGTFALNMTLAGISKANPVTALLGNPAILAELDLTRAELDPDRIEVWGDDFSAVRGGIDLDMCEALPPAVRTIDFRDEDPAELPADRNIVLWDGDYRLQDGLLEFLRSRES